MGAASVAPKKTVGKTDSKAHPLNGAVTENQNPTQPKAFLVQPGGLEEIGRLSALLARARPMKGIAASLAP
jgi:cell division septation protein DedD